MKKEYFNPQIKTILFYENIAAKIIEISGDFSGASSFDETAGEDNW